MYHYTIIQWLFFFYYYCFVGWCWESTYVSVKERRLINRGFLRGPFLPIYGSGATMMLVVSRPFLGHPLLVYLAGCVGATVLELVTGVTMEALFKVRYWDYSDQKFNFRGYICLSSTLTWGFFTIMMTQFVQRPIERAVFSIPGRMLTVITLVLTVIIACDLALTVKAASDLRDILFRMKRVKEELLHMQKRLDVIIAVAGDGLNAKREGIAESIDYRVGQIEDLLSSIGSRLERLKKWAVEKPSEYMDSVKEELGEFVVKYHVTLELKNTLVHMMDFYKRDLIRSNPGMRSEQYQDVLEELKRRVDRDDDDSGKSE